MTTWGTIDRPDWTGLVSFSNIGPYILPPAETNFDIVVQNNVTPSAHLTYNLTWAKRPLISKLLVRKRVLLQFDHKKWRGPAPIQLVLQPAPRQTFLWRARLLRDHSFLSGQELDFDGGIGNLISGLKLEISGPQLSWISADRLICTEMSVLNGPIS